MNTNDILEFDESYTAHTYARLNLVPHHGKNATIYDTEGKKYIDFTSGIGVNSLGVADRDWTMAIWYQLTKIQHISNYYYSKPTSKLAKKIALSSGMSKVIFQNSGAEANEAAIKVARKYSHDKYGDGRNKIITLVNSFHGRTVTTLSATGQDKFHTHFYPFTEGFEYAPAGDLNALKEKLDGSVCAIMCEMIQGEGGVNILDKDYVTAIREICDNDDILLIIDEVQTGIGRTGKFYAFEHYGIKPDIMSLAKGLGGGLPIGACVLGEKCAYVLAPGDHGTTFGGNPAVCAGANVVMDKMTPEFLKEITAKGEYIKDCIRALNLPFVTDVRGHGLMIGIEVTVSHKEIVGKCLENGLMILTAGSNVVRMLPPLTITYDEINAGLEILKKVLKSYENQ